MKSRCRTRKGSVYAGLAIALALLMLLCAIICVRLEQKLTFDWLTLRFADAGRLANVLSALVPVSCAIIVLAVCAAFCLGLKPKSLLLAAGALLLFSLCCYAVDLYLTVFIERESFFVISVEHIDVLFSLVIFLMTLLTVCNVIRSNAPLTLTAMILGLINPVLTMLQSGSFYRDGVTDISGLVFYLCGCMALALCALTLEWDAGAEALKKLNILFSEAPAASPAAVPSERPGRSLADGLPAPEPGYTWEQCGTDPDGTKLYVSRRIFLDAKTGAEVPGPYTDTWFPHAPKKGLPLPAEGCVWEKADVQQNGTGIYLERRMNYDPQTDQVIPGELTGVRFPPLEKDMARPEKQKAPAPQVAEQTPELLQQVEKLHESGILSDEEYRDKCKIIMDRV